MGSKVVADVKFFRGVFFALVVLTVLTGVLAGVTAVLALNADPSTCVFVCQ